MNKYIFILFAGVASLAAGGIFVRLSEVDPVATAVYRILFAMPLAFLWYKLETNKPITINLKTTLLLQLAGVFLAIDLILWHISFHLTTIANANLLANLIPFTVIPLSFIVFKEKIKPLFILALGIVITGLALLISGKIAITEENIRGDILAIATSFFYGLYFLIISHLRGNKNYSTGYILFVSGFGSLFVLIPYSLIFENNHFPSTGKGIAILLLIAVVSHLLGQGLLAVSLKNIKAALGSVLVLSQPVIAAIYSYIIFNEYLTIMEMIGICITISGIYIAKRSSH